MEEMMGFRQQSSTKLWQVNYKDENKSVWLVNYADTIVFDNSEDKTKLIAIRFGGYAEQVKGMADAINGGGSIFVEFDDKTLFLHCKAKCYQRKITNDGIYTEVLLSLKDDKIENNPEIDDCDTKVTIQQPKQVSIDESSDIMRMSYIYCEKENEEQLFNVIDSKVSVPLIPSFQSYLLTELKSRGFLSRLNVLSCGENFDVWKLILDVNDSNVTKIVEDGLRSGVITIPGVIKEDSFAGVNTVMEYLKQFGDVIADRIKKQFNSLFDPTVDKLSEEILIVNKNIRKLAV